jgi:hypothetical protein
MKDDGPGESTARLLARFEPPESAGRDAPRGALAFAENRPSRAAAVLSRAARREGLTEKTQNNGARSLDPLRDIRYFSGPWEGAGSELMPVSWFLLWRSNVSWVPDPAHMEKEAIGRGELAASSQRKRTTVPKRLRPADFKHRPAGSRTMPADATASRAKPSMEE